MKMKISLKWLSRGVICYMLLAFFWWAVHLWNENERLFTVERELLELHFTKKNQGLNETQFKQTSEYQGIESHWRKRKRMIIGEGLFFTVCLFFGLFVINRSANREVSLARQRRNFLLSITHELKSPIASMRLIFETMAKHDLTREQLEKLYANGLRDAGRLQSLVESLLLAARLEDNWRPLHEPVKLEALAQEIVAGLRLRFPEANFKIRMPESFPPIQADKSGLRSILQNLLENAVKYSPEAAAIELSAEKTPAGKLYLQISDSGLGIPDGEKKAVFEKFYRIGNEETRNTTGTGLGLYIVQQVVKAHGWQITLTDNKPQGTVFTIEI